MHGVSAKTAHSASLEFVAHDLNNIYSFVEPFCSLMDSLEIKVIIISGAPSIVLEAYKNYIKFDRIYGVDIKIGDDGIYTRDFVCNYATKQNKILAINELILQNTDIIFSLGDTTSDIPLLKAAKHAFVVSESNSGAGVHGQALNRIAQVVRPSQILPQIIKIVQP